MQLLLDLRRRVGLERADLGAHRLRDCPEGAAAVGERPSLPPVGELELGLDPLEELPDQAALPHAGNADERHELQRPAAGAVERVVREPDLELATDEIGRAVVRDVDAEACPRRDRLPGRHRLRLALGRDPVGVAVLDHPLGRAVGRSADEDAVHGGRRLEARGGVDDVAGDQRLAFRRVRVERDERLAGVDRRANLEAVLDQRVTDRERRAHGALRIVLMRDRRAEDGHHRVADELLDGAAEALELSRAASVVGRKRRAHVLGIGALRRAPCGRRGRRRRR